jgi:hypothetical protein
MTHRQAKFVEANRTSPVVYGGAFEDGCVYRLADGQVFNLTGKEASEIGHPRWAHLPELTS